MRRQPHPLGLAARKRGGGLAEAQVTEADFLQDAQLLRDARMTAEERERLRTVIPSTS